MKRFLSLVLAILMVVSVVPTFIFSIGAEGEGSADGANGAASEFPSLIITEVHANSINYNSNRNNWVKDATVGNVFYHMPEYDNGYTYYAARNPAVGSDVSSYFEMVERNGKKEYVKTSDATAVEGKNYYSVQTPSGVYDVFEYIEIYNSGDKAVNLYDYNLMYDSDGSYDNNTVIRNPMHAGGVSSSMHKSHFERYLVAEGESVKGLYTRDSASAYTACADDAVAAAGTVYYRLVENKYYVENPETAILQPGECAVVWFYAWGDWVSLATVEQFKTYYEYYFSQEKRGSYGVDLSNTLVIAIDAWSDTKMFGTSNAFDVQDAGQRIYGIANKSITDDSDTSRYDKWESWAYWAAYSGIDVANTAKPVDVTIGVTNVTGGTYAVKLEDTGKFAFPNVDDGTADANGCAVLGFQYYTVNINDGSNKSPLANKNDNKSANFLYGFNASAPLEEGWPYTIANSALNPGQLTHVQRDVLPNGKTETSVPEIVITEVCPDSVGNDEYEYLEVVNTSGHAINIYDYTVLVRTSSYQDNINNEYFNRYNTLIPGNVGNILAADPGSYYYHKAPTNPDYESGWLQPGEVAVLWSYYTETYAANATFDDFYNFYELDRSVKVFAMDTDNSARTGRPNEVQNLGNSGFYMYGIARNDNLKWYSDPYVSGVVMGPVTYGNGVTYSNMGVSLSVAESYVMANSVMCTGQNVGLGEGYGYQITYDRVEGTANRFGALVDIARLLRYDNDNKFVFSGSVVNADWKSSPGKLIDAQKTSMTTNKGASRYVIYMQDFDAMGNVAGYDEVASALGFGGVKNNALLSDEHMNNVKETEAKGVDFLEVRDGKLYVRNYGSSDDYMLLMSDAILEKVRDGSFTIEFSMTYNSDCISDGYSTVLYNFNGADLSYGAPIIRVSGYGNNVVYMNNQMSYVEDLSTTANAGVNMNSSNLSGATTLYERLTGKDISSIAGGNSLEGSVVMVDKTMNVKVDVSVTSGVTVTVNDVVVSESFDAVDSAMFANWGLFLEKTVGTDLVLKTTPNVSVSYDYITVYTDSVDANGADMDIPDLYITELLMDCGGWDFLQDTSKTSGSLGWIEYIEVTNGSDKPVALKDYSIVTTTRNGYMHEGNNIKWTGDGDRGAMNFDTWLGTGDCKARITKDGTVYNPSENEAVLQPGESILIFTIDTDIKLTQPNMSGTTVDYLSAVRDWLKLSEDQLCMVTTKKEATIEDVDPTTLAVVGNPVRKAGTFNNWNSAACVYGIGRNYDRNGNAINWKEVYTHDYRYLESFINFLPAIAVGQGSVGYTSTGDDRADGGSALNYPSHYAYGIDSSTHYKQGMLFTRRPAPAITHYNADGSVKAAGQYNAGKLYQLQQTCFDNIRKLKNGEYTSGGGLVISEMIMHTNDSLGTGWQAYEAMEITNTSALPINLYDYALAKAEDGTYANPESWGLVNELRAGLPVSRYHRWYDKLKDISNSDDGMIQPGESVVVWIYTADSYNFATENPTFAVNVKAFRQYWADRNNAKIMETDANGLYTTRVFTTVHVDAHATFNGYDQASTNYGLAKKTEFAFGNKIVRPNSIVSSTVSPHYVMYYDLDWKTVQLVPQSTYLTLPFGGSLTGSFGWHEELVEQVDLAAELNPSNLCVKNADGTYSFAAKPYTADNTYYKLYYYFNVQSISANCEDDLSFNYVYGNLMTGSWNQGGPLDTVKASYYMYNSSGKKWSTTPSDINVTPYVKIDLLFGGNRQNSLGYLIDEQKGMVANANFDYVGELDDGTAVYFYRGVMGDLSGIKVTNLGASVSFPSGGTDISFSASVSYDFYNTLVAKFGKDAIGVGIITVRAEDAMEAGMIRPQLLDEAGVDYVCDDALRPVVMPGAVEFYGTSQKMQQGYYRDTYSSVGFIRIETCIGTVTLYAETAENQSTKQVLASAIEDYSDVRTDEYCYAVENGKWSRYTAEQRARFEKLCAR